MTSCPWSTRSFSSNGCPQANSPSSTRGTSRGRTPPTSTRRSPRAGGTEATRPPATELATDLADEGSRISFARVGFTVSWNSRFQNLLELAEACDVPVPWSCQTRVCHTCESGLISGSVNYDPEPLDAPAIGNLLICCSRPQEDTVIDL
ncbi:2Fe-2S iron-sulfur cluster binding domain-containing protein [Coleofasciculus sp. FACHB-SPT9]|nr:2Fe-2S iron-sulfur cluster binding domain-containing protein [Coleofasciculus sp. FACHB-SPT9]